MVSFYNPFSSHRRRRPPAILVNRARALEKVIEEKTTVVIIFFPLFFLLLFFYRLLFQSAPAIRSIQHGPFPNLSTALLLHSLYTWAPGLFSAHGKRAPEGEIRLPFCFVLIFLYTFPYSFHLLLFPLFGSIFTCDDQTWTSGGPYTTRHSDVTKSRLLLIRSKSKSSWNNHIRFRPTIPLACDFLLPVVISFRIKSVVLCVQCPSWHHRLPLALLFSRPAAAARHHIPTRTYNWWRFLFFFLVELRYFFACFRSPFFLISVSLSPLCGLSVDLALSSPVIQLNKLESVAYTHSQENHLRKSIIKLSMLPHMLPSCSRLGSFSWLPPAPVWLLWQSFWFENSPAVVAILPCPVGLVFWNSVKY